jgi:hypothetical protein
MAAVRLSPENQVFQFMASLSYAGFENRPRSCAAYLWIPPSCSLVRGVVVLGRNVPEHMLAGHPAIRQACTEAELALLWTCPSFFDPKIKDGKLHGAVLQRLLNELAETSGYGEIASVPWLPVGESMHLLMVARLVEAFPERCLAGVLVKNWTAFKANEVSILAAIGTCMEWDQEKLDLLNQWRNTSAHGKVEAQRAAVPKWPGSLWLEGGAGHFECSEAMTTYIERYIIAAARARLPDKPGAPLRAVNLGAGYVAGLPVPTVQRPVRPARAGDRESASLPWYFTESLAHDAWKMADIDWQRNSQVPIFATADGSPVAFGIRGITWPIPFATGDDGVTFDLGATFLARIPEGWVSAGTPLGHAAGAPVVDWICGQVTALGGNRFRIALDRTWPDCPTYLVVRHPGDAVYRPSVQPGRLVLAPNRQGRPQTITFAPIPDQAIGANEVGLRAASDAGMKVEFFVRSGPAEVRNDRLVFTPLPPRARFPVKVTVAAYQWGRTRAPQVQTAELIEQSFWLRPR